ncbi:MAG: efflux RND transporter permease subunit, partial [Wohlfahrtiimonas sp.]
MKISDISIKRPVFAIVLNILIILLGVVGLTRMSIREYPNIDLPVISIRTTYSGASPEIIETQVTKAIEDAVTSIDGIDFMTSMSRRGMSFVNISFQPSKNIEEAANDVRDRVARAKYLLPDDVDEPIINKSDSDADPVMILTLTSEKLSSIELTKIVENNIKPQVELLEGVSNLEIWGGRDPVMRVWLDPEKMSAFDIAITDIEAALRAQNVEIPAGSIKSNARELDIVAQTDLNTVDEFNNIIVKTTNRAGSIGNQHIVRLGDLASVELGGVEETSRPRMNGKRGVGIAIIKQSVANPLTISSAIREVLPTLQETLPDDVKLEISSDNSIFINKSLQSVYSTIIEALIFVGIIIFFFLRDWRATIVPMVTVPIALVGTLFAMYLLGYSINTLTMLAFVLAIGLVVDDAIVMLENIHRHIEAGLSPVKAAFVGSKEIGLAIIAMTITLAAVFLPLTFTEGRIGKLFIEFAVTLSIAVIISGFTALTLSPMMCSRLLKADHKKGKLFNIIENMFIAFTNGYTKLLRWVLPKSFFVIVGMIMTLGASYFFYMQLPQMLSPTEDRGFVRVSAITPEGATVDFTDRYFTEIEDLLINELPKATVFVVSGVASGGIGNITLEDWDLRSESQMSIVQRLNKQFQDIALGLRVFASNPQSLGQDSRSKEVEVVIRSTASFEELDQYVTQIMQTLNNDQRLVTPDNNLRLNTPQLEVDVDREKLALLGIDVN